MKNKKLITLVCCLALVAAMSLGATVAYLTANGSVTNTFTVGKITDPDQPDEPTVDDPKLAGTLDEAKVDEYGVKDKEATERVLANEYKLVPGHTYVKDPTVHVGPNSEKCYVFVKVENGISAVTEDITMETAWTALDGADGVYYQVCEATGDANANFVAFNTFTVKSGVEAADLEAVKDGKIVVNAYIIQYDGFSSASEAYAAVDSAKTEE